MEKEIIDLIMRQGPLTGSELREALGCDCFLLWKTCMRSSLLTIHKLGTQYLRLDRQVDGFARLSPSILREFLTYSVIGRATDTQALDHRAQGITARIKAISAHKFDLAQRLIAAILRRLEGSGPCENQLCVVIAGDIVYDMAHDVPRPERSTGKMVAGSDLDLIVILNDAVPQEQMDNLDNAIYQEKYRTLINPAVKEEIDYIVKRIGRIREQVAFDDFKNMVACKILQEGKLLYGSQDVFRAAKAVLARSGALEKLHAMQYRAAAFRKTAEQSLLNGPRESLSKDCLHLFYTAEESEEFE